MSNYQNIDNKVRDLSVMYEIISSFGATLNLKLEADNFLGKVLKRFGYDMGSIMLKDRERNTFRIVAAKGYFRTEELIDTEYHPGQFGIEDTILSGAAIVKNELSMTDRESIILPYIRTKINSYAFLPINFENELIGILRLFSLKEGSFSERSVKMLESLTRRFANIINHIKVIDKLADIQALLLEERERLFTTLQSIADSVITTDIHGKVTFINKKAEEITGWQFEEALGEPVQRVFRILKGEKGELDDNPLESVFTTGEAISLGGHITLITKEGTKKIISSNICSPIISRSGKVTGAVLIFKDIIDKELIDKEFIKTKKLESLGLLAGGIAHDFNNLLTAILGNVGLAMAYLPTEHKTYSRLKEVEKASLKARDLVNQLLTFSKGGEPVKKVISVSQLIKEIASLVLIGSNVKCEFFIPEDIWPIFADEGQMGQVLHNILLNACQAMPSGGTIKIVCDNILIEKDRLLPLSKGEYVKICIEDEGVGIAQEDLLKIFDPYYTTKPKGTGLGLSMAYSIIKRHGGYITVDSIIGKGTKFIIYLPSCKKPVEILKNSYIKTSDKKQFGKKILVMDDEDLIIDFLKDALIQTGYHVECVKDGRQALNLYKKALNSGEQFDLVILDYTIPGGMGGKETIAKLLKINPSVKAIVSSGYTEDPIMTEYRKYGFSGILTKPYEIKDLLKTIESCLLSG